MKPLYAFRNLNKAHKVLTIGGIFFIVLGIFINIIDWHPIEILIPLSGLLCLWFVYIDKKNC